MSLNRPFIAIVFFQLSTLLSCCIFFTTPNNSHYISFFFPQFAHKRPSPSTCCPTPASWSWLTRPVAGGRVTAWWWPALTTPCFRRRSSTCCPAQPAPSTRSKCKVSRSVTLSIRQSLCAEARLWQAGVVCPYRAELFGKLSKRDVYLCCKACFVSLRFQSGTGVRLHKHVWDAGSSHAPGSGLNWLRGSLPFTPEPGWDDELEPTGRVCEEDETSLEIMNI